MMINSGKMKVVNSKIETCRPRVYFFLSGINGV
jgi:hypothetical protein